MFETFDEQDIQVLNASAIKFIAEMSLEFFSFPWQYIGKKC